MRILNMVKHLQWSFFAEILNFLGQRFENVTCRTKNGYIRWFENACFFSYSSNHIVSSFSLTSENIETYKLVCFKESASFSRCLLKWKDLYTRCVIILSFISCRLMYDNTFFHWCSLLSGNMCFLSINAVQSLVERSDLYISLWNICFRKWQRVTLQNK